MKQTAIIIGSTGLIGNSLLELLINENQYEKIIAFVRKPIISSNKKLVYVETDFSKLSKIEHQIKGDCLFVCIGSTMAKAGSKEAFTMVDYTIPTQFAKIALKNAVSSCIVVSSLGADANSSNFYLQTKGKMEKTIVALGFKNTIFMRPSMLFGERTEFRMGELIGKFFMKILGPLFLGPLKKYKGIEVSTVAQAMLLESLKPFNGIKVYESNQIDILSKK